MRDAVGLVSSPTAWRPGRLRRMSEREEGVRKARGLLNKLTPDNFDRIVQQFVAIPITKVETLRALTAVVFEKAVAEQSFWCASLTCLSLLSVSVFVYMRRVCVFGLEQAHTMMCVQ